MLRSRLVALSLYQRTLEAQGLSLRSSSLTGLPKWPKMCPSVARIGCKPKSRNEAVTTGSGSCPVPLRCMPASHRASDDVEHDSGLTLSTPLRRPPMRLKSCCRRDDHRSCYDVRSGPPPDHPVHSAARRDHVVISTVIALLSH